MSARRAVAAILLLALAAPARAGLLGDPAPSVSGPGGSGAAYFDDPLTLYMDINYTTGEYLDLSFAADGPDTITLTGMISNYGFTPSWNNFQFEIIGAPAGTAFTSATDTIGVFPSTNPSFTTPLTAFAFGGGLLPTTYTFEPQITLAVGGAGTITIRQTPAWLGATPVTEPPARVLATLGVSGLIAHGIRRRRRA